MVSKDFVVVLPSSRKEFIIFALPTFLYTCVLPKTISYCWSVGRAATTNDHDRSRELDAGTRSNEPTPQFLLRRCRDDEIKSMRELLVNDDCSRERRALAVDL